MAIGRIRYGRASWGSTVLASAILALSCGAAAQSTVDVPETQTLLDAFFESEAVFGPPERSPGAPQCSVVARYGPAKEKRAVVRNNQDLINWMNAEPAQGVVTAELSLVYDANAKTYALAVTSANLGAVSEPMRGRALITYTPYPGTEALNGTLSLQKVVGRNPPENLFYSFQEDSEEYRYLRTKATKLEIYFSTPADKTTRRLYFDLPFIARPIDGDGPLLDVKRCAEQYAATL